MAQNTGFSGNGDKFGDKWETGYEDGTWRERALNNVNGQNWLLTALKRRGSPIDHNYFSWLIIYMFRWLDSQLVPLLMIY
jgi:hypothetical protein